MILILLIRTALQVASNETQSVSVTPRAICCNRIRQTCFALLCIVAFPFLILWFLIHYLLKIRVNKGFYVDVQRVPLYEAVDYFVRMRVLYNTPFFVFFTFPMLCLLGFFGTAYEFREYPAGWIVSLCLNSLWMFIGYFVV